MHVHVHSGLAYKSFILQFFSFTFQYKSSTDKRNRYFACNTADTATFRNKLKHPQLKINRIIEALWYHFTYPIDSNSKVQGSLVIERKGAITMHLPKTLIFKCILFKDILNILPHIHYLERLDTI